MGVSGVGPATYFASPERATAEELSAARAAFLRTARAQELLDALPEPALVLNPQRQVVAANAAALAMVGASSCDELLGLRPGECAGCINLADAPSGCGTSQACTWCGAVNAILDAQQTRAVAQRECRLTLVGEAGQQSLELSVQATFMALPEVDLVIVVMRDISHEKRRQVLERAFFHDVMNTAGGILGLSELVAEMAKGAEAGSLAGDLHHLAEGLIDEIQAQRQLLSAENGDLQVQFEAYSLASLVQPVLKAYSHHLVSGGRRLEVARLDAVSVETDATLLRRVLGNLVKNALEATDEDGAVTVAGWAEPQRVVFTVHNPSVMPPSVQAQLFQRSFSTKSSAGRGIGTFSVKLLTERYLGGQVSFASAAPDGTTFTLSLPRRR